MTLPKSLFTRHLHFGIILLSIISACRKDLQPGAIERDLPIQFSSEIKGLPQTRMRGTTWNAGDSIGIFMYSTGTSLDISTVVGEGFNKAYETDGNGNFSPRDPNDQLIFPQNQKVQFLAYYPYRKLSNLAPLVDVSDQTNPEAIDFLVSKGPSGHASRGPVQLSFERQMAKMEFKISGNDINGLQATWLNLPTTAAYHLPDGSFDVPQAAIDVPANVHYNGSGEVTISWTFFPNTTTTPQQIVFKKANGQTYTWHIPVSTTFSKGHRYQYDLTLGSMGDVNPIPTASYPELPIIKTGEHLIYSFKMGNSRRNYSILYNTEHMLAEWVAYPISSGYLANLSRSNAWDYDPDPAIGSYFQADLIRGYPNNIALDLDRGHQIASGDRTSSLLENRQTFYYTNITPQIKSLNQGVWNRLEIQVRSWATAPGVDTLYVVTGAGVRTANNHTLDYVLDNSNRKVVKPKYYYKALAMKKGNTYYTAGFRFDNVSAALNANHMDNILTVAELEKETGLTFFPSLPTEIKTTINRQIWR